MPRVRLQAVVAPACLAAAVCGCSPDARTVHNWLLEHREQGTSIDYRIGIPDAVSISAPRVPEIDGETQTIQPDGKITLRLLGDVRVVGMTAREVAAKLTTLLHEYYEDPKVHVRVSQFASKKIYVFGQVGQGAIGGPIGGTCLSYTGKNSLLDTLATTGVSIIAWRSQVKVIRANADPDKRHVLTVDIDRMMTQGDTSLNVLLEPGDIVYIPPTPLGWLGLRIQEVLFPFGTVLNAYMTPAGVMNANDQYKNH